MTNNTTLQQYAKEITDTLRKAGMGDEELRETLTELDLSAFEAIADEQYDSLNPEQQNALDSIDETKQYTKQELAAMINLTEEAFDARFLEEVKRYLENLNENSDLIKTEIAALNEK